MSKTLNGLLTSRKVWLAVLGVLTAVVANYLSVPDDVWLSIEGLLLTIIITITVEDAAEKLSGGHPGE